MSLSIPESRTRLPIYGLSATHIPTGPLLAPTTFGLQQKGVFHLIIHTPRVYEWCCFLPEAFYHRIRRWPKWRHPYLLVGIPTDLRLLVFVLGSFSRDEQQQTAYWVGREPQSEWLTETHGKVPTKMYCCHGDTVLPAGTASDQIIRYSIKI